jgi:pimeloyl-ACP methyl ester carboxylesterase
MPLLNLDNGKKLHYRDIKPSTPDGPRETFVFTHGLGSSQNYYAPLTPSFTRENIRCIAFDTTGAGRSPTVHSAVQTTLTLGEDIIALMDHLTVEKAVLVGHSMGGMVAAEVAVRFRERIVATVWIGPVYPGPQVGEIFGYVHLSLRFVLE